MVSRLCASFALLAVMLSAGCDSLPAGSDRLCSEIARFANTSDGHGTGTVELVLDWGGVFSGDKDVMYDKTCKHDAGAPGKRLCDYLMANTSNEFPTVNLRRALTCLGAQEYVGPANVQVSYLNGKVTSYSARGVRPEVSVSIEFETGSNEQPPSLKISVD